MKGRNPNWEKYMPIFDGEKLVIACDVRLPLGQYSELYFCTVRVDGNFSSGAAEYEKSFSADFVEAHNRYEDGEAPALHYRTQIERPQSSSKLSVPACLIHGRA
jgi:hypothetical protein